MARALDSRIPILNPTASRCPRLRAIPILAAPPVFVSLAPSTPLAAMPRPAPGSPAAAEDGERPCPPPMKMKLVAMKMKLVAMYLVLRGTGPRGEIVAVAYVGIYFVLYVVTALSILSPAAARVQFWDPVQLVVLCLCFAATVLVLFDFIRRYMAVDPQQQLEATLLADLLPPPPPEMDMC